MAIRIDKKISWNAVRLISENDDALDKGENEDDWKETVWAKYKKTLNPDDLTFVPDCQPTIFLCNFELKAHDTAAIKDAMLKGGNQVAFGSWSQAVAKHVLKDIINPEYVPMDERIAFRKDGMGLAHDEVIGFLDRVGVVTEIFTAYNEKTSSFKASSKN